MMLQHDGGDDRLYKHIPGEFREQRYILLRLLIQHHRLMLICPLHGLLAGQ